MDRLQVSVKYGAKEEAALPQPGETTFSTFNLRVTLPLPDYIIPLSGEGDLSSLSHSIHTFAVYVNCGRKLLGK